MVLRCPVERTERTAEGLYRLATGGEVPGVITCRHLVMSAGLSASKLARTLELSAGYSVPQTHYAKGQYYGRRPGPSPFKRHIYPVPDGAWLGLHATVDIGGRCKFGPDIEWIDEIDYGFEPEKLEKFLGFIRSYYPGLDAVACTPTTRASAPSSTARASRCPTSPSTAQSGTDCRASSPSTASRARPYGVAGHRRDGGGDAGAGRDAVKGAGRRETARNRGAPSGCGRRRSCFDGSM